ncbi:MAG: FkbM family methyltransferase [Ferruginibacter sp.]|nr:FkbM family methyltransferase [Ferruginibacter sp.]
MSKFPGKMEMFGAMLSLFHKTGLDVRRFPTRDQRKLMHYLNQHGVNDCFDVGANTGQFALLLRSIGFKGNIFSFEPQTKAFQELRSSSDGAKRWNVYNIALGNTDASVKINISENSVSSSLLEISQLLTDVAPETKYISSEEVEVKRLDNFLEGIDFHRKFFLKIDAQGFEAKILEGAENCFDLIYALQIELTCVSLYKGEKLFDEMKSFIESKGFYLSGIESGFADMKTGRLLQVEAIFLRDA